MKKILVILFVLLISQVVLAQTKIDEYGKLISDDEGSRLYAISQQLLQNKESRIYVLINKEKKMPFGRFLRYFYGVGNFINRLGVPKESITILAGKVRDEQFTQIWIVHKNEKPPDFKQISIKDKLSVKIKRKVLFDENCIDCDESPFIKQNILGEGIDYLATVLKANPNIIASIQIVNGDSFIENRERFIKEISNRVFKITETKQLGSFLFKRETNSVIRFYLFPKPPKT